MPRVRLVNPKRKRRGRGNAGRDRKKNCRRKFIHASSRLPTTLVHARMLVVELPRICDTARNFPVLHALVSLNAIIK
jgi:hypothetical protein